MKNKNKILWGILLLIGALALVLFAFFPSLNIFGDAVPIWKVLVAMILLYWLLNRLVLGKKGVDHFDFLFPLSLMYALFFEEINKYLAHGTLNPNTIWIVIVASLLIQGSLRLIFNKATVEVHADVDGESYAGISGGEKNSFGSKILCLDASESLHSVSNRFGDLSVLFQNTEIENAGELNLQVSNQFGEVSVRVPSDWKVQCEIDDSFGSHSVRPNAPETVRTIRITGSNAFGEVNILSD